MIAYVLYKGDEVLGVGTANELAKRFGVTPQTIANYATESHRLRENRQIVAEPVPVRQEDFDPMT